MNVLLQSAEHSISWQEVPIQTVYLDQKNSVSHFQPFRDSIQIYRSIFKFSGSSLLSFLLDYGLFNLFPLILPISAGNILARVISCLFNYKLKIDLKYKCNSEKIMTHKAARVIMGVVTQP